MKKKLILKLIIAVLISSFFVEVNPTAAPATQYSNVTTAQSGTGNGATTSNIKQIAEFSATATVTNGNDGGYSMGYTDLNGNKNTYSNGSLQVNFAGNNYMAYCLDPGLKMPEGNMTCKAINRSPQINSLVQYAADANSDQETTQLAYRIWAAITGWTQQYDKDFDEKTQHAFKETVSIYNDLINGTDAQKEAAMNRLKEEKFCDSQNCNSPEEAAAAMFGADKTTFQDAFKIAYEAKQQGTYKYDASEHVQGGVSFQVISENDRTITYKLSSGYKIPESGFKIDCVGCNIKANKEWTGYGGEYTITIPEGGCDAALDLYYETQGSYECSSNSPGTQTIYTHVDQQSTDVVQTVDVKLFNVEGCSECCEEETPGKSVNVNNCCYDGTTSEVREPELNSLFCKDEKLNLEYFFEKCGADPYMEEINDFCNIWCTERVNVETPGAVTATSGRYFELNKTSKGTKSPYVLGFKRCRVKVDLELWFTRYQAMLEQQKAAFDDYQRFGASQKMVEEMDRKTVTLTGTTTCGHSGSSADPCTGDWEVKPKKNWLGQVIGEYKETICPSQTDSESMEVRVYQLKNVRPYHIAFQSGSLDSENKYDKNSFNNIYMWLSHVEHNVTEFVTNEEQWGSNKNRLPVSSNLKIIEYDDKLALKRAIDNMATQVKNSVKSNCKVVATCIRENEDGEIEEEVKDLTITPQCSTDYPDEFDQYREFGMVDFEAALPGKLSNAQGRYSDATARGKKLEEDIELCTKYFNKVDPKSIYQMNPSVSLSYTQSYLDDKADLKTDEIQIPFEGSPGCTISLAGTSGDGEIMDPQYAEKYTKQDKLAHLSDMKDATLYYFEKRDEGAFNSTFRDEEYELDKKSTHDGKIKAECYWEEKDNTVYTLAQSGALEKETMPTKNFTIHNRQYEVHLSTLEGKYETMWKMRGMGSNGKFDQDFLHAGTSCSANDPEKVGMFTCAVEVEHEVVLTGYCNGQGAHGVQNGISNCEPFKEGYELVNFKVVDPADLFPAFNDPAVTPSYNGKTYGHNWVEDPEGQEVLGAIQSTGQADETYAPKNLSYSFTLAPQDMQEIKDYNESRIGDGGYTDFNLTCECPSGNIPVNSTASCNRCRSTFIDQLASGSLGGANENSGWSNERESLGTVRGKNHW